jgi:hypothetical protein
MAPLGGHWCSVAPGGAGWWKLVKAWFRVAFAWRQWRRLNTPFRAKMHATRVWPESFRHIPDQLRPNGSADFMPESIDLWHRAVTFLSPNLCRSVSIRG